MATEGATEARLKLAHMASRVRCARSHPRRLINLLSRGPDMADDGGRLRRLMGHLEGRWRLRLQLATAQQVARLQRVLA